MTADGIEEDSVSESQLLAEDLRRAVSTFVRVIREKTDSEKSAQSETLTLLDREGAMNIAALAQRRSVAHQTMRVIVAQLVGGGLVERSPNPQDRRSQLLSLSDAGRRQVARDRHLRASRISATIEKTLSEAERQRLYDLVNLLNRISATVDD